MDITPEVDLKYKSFKLFFNNDSMIHHHRYWYRQLPADEKKTKTELAIKSPREIQEIQMHVIRGSEDA